MEHWDWTATRIICAWVRTIRHLQFITDDNGRHFDVSYLCTRQTPTIKTSREGISTCCVGRNRSKYFGRIATAVMNRGGSRCSLGGSVILSFDTPFGQNIWHFCSTQMHWIYLDQDKLQIFLDWCYETVIYYKLKFKNNFHVKSMWHKQQLCFESRNFMRKVHWKIFLLQN